METSNHMPTATTTTGQHTTNRTTTQPTNNPATQTSRNAAQRLCTTMAAVKLSFTWLGVRKTLAPDQRTTANVFRNGAHRREIESIARPNG